jgi:hypothetical protein
VSSLRLVLCAHVDSRLVFYPRRWGISEALRVNLGDGITVLLFFMEAHRALPDEALIPTRIVLEASSFDTLAEALERPPAPPKALRELMRGARR